jgi:hypothetical protein
VCAERVGGRCERGVHGVHGLNGRSRCGPETQARPGKTGTVGQVANLTHRPVRTNFARRRITLPQVIRTYIHTYLDEKIGYQWPKQLSACHSTYVTPIYVHTHLLSEVYLSSTSLHGAMELGT